MFLIDRSGKKVNILFEYNWSEIGYRVIMTCIEVMHGQIDVNVNILFEYNWSEIGYRVIMTYIEVMHGQVDVK